MIDAIAKICCHDMARDSYNCRKERRGGARYVSDEAQAILHNVYYNACGMKVRKCAHGSLPAPSRLDDCARL